MEHEAFQTLLRCVRSGDAHAAAQLVRAYEPALRRQVRMHLTDPRLRRLVDTVDVCQSVLGTFFIRMIAGEFDLESPNQLVGLLAVMAQNRIHNHVRYQQADCRDVRRLHPGGTEALLTAEDGAPSPSDAVADAELLQRILDALTDQERRLLDQRAAGLSWQAISALENESAGSLRKRLARGLRQAALRLGIEGVEDV